MAKVNLTNLFKSGIYGNVRSRQTIKTYIHNVRDAFENVLLIPKHRLDNVKITRRLLHKLISIDIDILKDKLKDIEIRKKKRIINILIVLSVALNREKNLKDYRAYLAELRGKLQKIVDKNLPNDKQRNNWITMDEFDKLIIDLSVKADDIFTAKNFEKATLNDIQLLIILKMYRLHFLRNDFTDLLIITPRAFNKLKDNTRKNYLILTKVKRKIVLMEVVLNNYKTKKVYQQQIIEFKDLSLLSLVTKYLKIRPKSRWFLVNQAGEKLSKLNFSTWFSRQMKKISGKSIGSSLLRHIFCSRDIDENFKSIEERKVEASGMLHSLGQHDEYKLKI